MSEVWGYVGHEPYLDWGLITRIHHVRKKKDNCRKVREINRYSTGIVYSLE